MTIIFIFIFIMLFIAWGAIGLMVLDKVDKDIDIHSIFSIDFLKKTFMYFTLGPVAWLIWTLMVFCVICDNTKVYFDSVTGKIGKKFDKFLR